MSTAAQPAADSALLPLFPLQSVLFPGGLLQLRVFEARYLDLISQCLRQRSSFGVVCLLQGGEVARGKQPVRLETVGVQAKLLDVDADQAGILRVRCQGGARLTLGTAQQRADGLWLAAATAVPDDAPATVPEALQPCARALGQAIESMAEQGQHPFLAPHRLDDAGWVANRWCEILPISLAAKQGLMVLDEPQLRLKLVDEFLRNKGVL